MTTMTSPTPSPSLLDKLTNGIYLDYVLKVGGIVILVLAIINGWGHLTLLEKVGFITGPIMWYVGAKFDKIYR